MAIAFSQVASANSNNGNSTTHTYTGNGLASVTAVTNGIAFVAFDSVGLGADPTSVTWGGAAMTKIATRNQTNRSATESLWYILNPSSGAVSIVDNYASANSPNMTWAVYSGVKQVAPEASNTGYSASSSLGVSVTTISANAWVMGFFTNNFGTGVVGANTTARATNVLCIGDTNGPVVTPSSQAQNWTGGTEWTGIVAAFAPAITSATTFTFTGPASGNVNTASTNFTVTPNAAYTGTITLTPTGTGSSGLSPTVLTFTASATPQTFTITPTVVGSITLTPTNSGGLLNPSNLTYTVNGTVPSAPPAPVAVAGNAQATVTVSAPSNTGGSAITLYTIVSTPGGLQDTSAVPGPITVNGLINGTSYTWVVKATNSTGDSAYSSASNSVTPVAPPTPNTTFTNNGPKFNISRTVGNLISF